MHWNFSTASNAFTRALEEDPYYNDSTWNVTYVDSHDYGPDMDTRYNGGTQAWAENLSLLFTFRGIPCLYYGSEVEFHISAIILRVMFQLLISVNIAHQEQLPKLLILRLLFTLNNLI